MKHVLLLGYVGWAVCQLEAEFANWMLRRAHRDFPAWAPELTGVCSECVARLEASR